MNDLGRQGADHAAEYIGAVKGTWPLVLIAGAVATASAARQLKRGYKQRSRKEQVVTALLNAALTTSMAVSCALLLPLVLPGVTPEMQVAVSMAVSGLGGETVKLWLLKKLGLSVVDLMNPDDINDIRRTMPPELRRKHAEQCPFRGDECPVENEHGEAHAETAEIRTGVSD